MSQAVDNMITAAEMTIKAYEFQLSQAEWSSDRQIFRERIQHEIGVLSGLRQAKFALIAEEDAR